MRGAGRWKHGLGEGQSYGLGDALSRNHVREGKTLNYDALVPSVPVELLGTLVTLAIVPVTGELGLAL